MLVCPLTIRMMLMMKMTELRLNRGRFMRHMAAFTTQLKCDMCARATHEVAHVFGGLHTYATRRRENLHMCFIEAVKMLELLVVWFDELKILSRSVLLRFSECRRL